MAKFDITAMEQLDIFENEKRIAHQNFNAPVVMGAFSLAMTYVAHFSAEPYKIIATIPGMMAYVFFLLSFARYLQNFEVGKAIHWVNSNIIITLVILFLALASRVFEQYSDILHKHKYLLLRAIVAIAGMFTVVFSIVVCVQLGRSLLQVKNDFVGLLKPLGLLFCYLTPVIWGLFIALAFAKYLRHNDALWLTEITLGNIPTVVIISIFFRAKKY